MLFHRKVLLFASVTGFASFLDWELFPLCLIQIQSSLGVPEDRVGILGSLIRLGTGFSFVIAHEAVCFVFEFFCLCRNKI